MALSALLSRSLPGEHTTQRPPENFVLPQLTVPIDPASIQSKEQNGPIQMNYALQFYVDRDGVSYWIHGRGLPGYPTSHGCIGLYDEPMQKLQYGFPKDPELNDAKRLFEWALGGEVEDDRLILLPQGPRIRIIGRSPVVSKLERGQSVISGYVQTYG
jgi:hypothetical protein